MIYRSGTLLYMFYTQLFLCVMPVDTWSCSFHHDYYRGLHCSNTSHFSSPVDRHLACFLSFDFTKLQTYFCAGVWPLLQESEKYVFTQEGRTVMLQRYVAESWNLPLVLWPREKNGMGVVTDQKVTQEKVLPYQQHCSPQHPQHPEANLSELSTSGSNAGPSWVQQWEYCQEEERMTSKPCRVQNGTPAHSWTPAVRTRTRQGYKTGRAVQKPPKY